VGAPWNQWRVEWLVPCSRAWWSPPHRSRPSGWSSTSPTWRVNLRQTTTRGQRARAEPEQHPQSMWLPNAQTAALRHRLYTTVEGDRQTAGARRARGPRPTPAARARPPNRDRAAPHAEDSIGGGQRDAQFIFGLNILGRGFERRGPGAPHLRMQLGVGAWTMRGV